MSVKVVPVLGESRSLLSAPSSGGEGLSQRPCGRRADSGWQPGPLSRLRVGQQLGGWASLSGSGITELCCHILEM